MTSQGQYRYGVKSRSTSTFFNPGLIVPCNHMFMHSVVASCREWPCLLEIFKKQVLSLIFSGALMKACTKLWPSVGVVSSLKITVSFTIFRGESAADGDEPFRHWFSHLGEPQ